MPFFALRMKPIQCWVLLILINFNPGMNYFIILYGLKLLVHSSYSTVQPVEFRNRSVISLHILLSLLFPLHGGIIVNPSPSFVAYMRQLFRSALVQIMACRLFGAKLLSKPMLGYCQLDPWEQTSVKFESKYKTFVGENTIENVVCQNGSHFVQGGMS